MSFDHVCFFCALFFAADTPTSMEVLRQPGPRPGVVEVARLLDPRGVVDMVRDGGNCPGVEPGKRRRKLTAAAVKSAAA